MVLQRGRVVRAYGPDETPVKQGAVSPVPFVSTLQKRRRPYIDLDGRTNQGYAYALAAGACAASGSVCIKCFGDEVVSKALCSYGFECREGRMALAVWALRGLALGGYIFTQGQMWVLFVKALQRLPSVTAVVVNTSANVVASSLLGFAVFGEPLPLLWWMGISFMLVGVSLVVTEKDAPTDEAKHSYE